MCFSEVGIEKLGQYFTSVFPADFNRYDGAS